MAKCAAPNIYPKPISPGSYWARWIWESDEEPWETVHVELVTESDTLVVHSCLCSRPMPPEEWEFGPRIEPPE